MSTPYRYNWNALFYWLYEQAMIYHSLTRGAQWCDERHKPFSACYLAPNHDGPHFTPVSLVRIHQEG
jgi:hypothetical protein